MLAGIEGTLRKAPDQIWVIKPVQLTSKVPQTTTNLSWKQKQSICPIETVT
jgi:hypothetical protein